MVTQENPPLLVGVLNWLGDAVMLLPALAAFAEARGGSPLAAYGRGGLESVYRMGLGRRLGSYVPLPRDGGMKEAVRAVRALHAREAIVLPASPRAAWVPFAARIPRRRGFAGHFPRRFLLNDVVPLPPDAGKRHQVFEAYAVLGLTPPKERPRAHLEVPPEALRQACNLAGGEGGWVAVIPGAARGTSKQYAPERFAAVARGLREKTGRRAVVLGSAGEKAVCEEVAAGCGGTNLAGATTIETLAGLLAKSAIVLCNDSGGMHLAAAVGAKLVAFLGITDPDVTGPLTDRAAILQHAKRKARDIPRESPEARAALDAITPEEGIQAALELLRR
jgi:heptosyltransferase-2